MTTQVPVRLTERDLAALDQLVDSGSFRNRSEALRAGLATLLHEHREHEIEAAYRRGYDAHPQEDWIAAVGLAGLTAFHRAEDGEPL
jgi:Arc/MetJ-type ribon-helix-helix transcriptional regulator